MSGDSQPRKRKDKKRKKDESTEQTPPPHFTQPVTSTPIPNEDVNIHVHKDEGTGGGICAKIVFFFLFSALIVVIGLLITEHRGLTDLDTVDSESRFAQIFEGWTDESGHGHDEDDHLDHSLEKELEEEEHEDEDASHEEVEESDHDEEHEVEEQEASDEGTEEQDDDNDDDEEEEVEETSDEQRNEDDDEDEDQDRDATEEDEEEEGQMVQSEEEDGADNSEARSNEEDDNEIVTSEENVNEDDETNEDDDAEDLNVTDSGENYHESQEVDSEVDQRDEDNQEDAETTEKDYDEPDTDEAVPVKLDEANPEESTSPEKSRSLNVPDDNEPEESDSDKQSDDYEYENITNKEDLKIKEKIDEAQKKINDNVANAIKLFDLLLQNHPSSPRSLYGKAQALDKQAELTRSNGILQTAISLYKQVLTAENVPDPLFKMAAERCINRMRFAGSYNRAIDVHLMLIDRFPLDPHYRNQLAVSYLTINRVNEARAILQDTLAKHPNNGFALVHYGFILKTNDDKLQESVDYLRAGIATQEQGVIDGRFYFHLGDALARLGKNQEAVEVYEEGVRHKLFLSKYQRSLYNVPRLKGKPFWTPNETPYEDLYAALEKNWKLIRNEGLAVLSKTGYFQNESENLKDTGEWKQFELFARGQRNVKNCEKCPVTCAIIESFPDARGCRRGQTKFSVMHPGTHVWPHCGPTNCRLRVHLGLNVPPDTYIRVADQIRSWENGKIQIFDDSFEHEVWHNGTTFRLVLIVDVWHPELTQAEKRSLSPI